MSPCNELRQHPCTGKKFIKKGRLHSQKALFSRQQEWLENWSSLLQCSSKTLDELESSDDDTCEEPSLNEHSYSVPSVALQGFNMDECTMSVKMYFMLQDQINYFLQEEDLSTDEDEEIEDLTASDDDPILISVKFSAEQLRDCGYCEETASLLEWFGKDALETLSSLPDYHISPGDVSDGGDSDTGRIRPVSRISLRLPYDHSEDDYDSYFQSGSMSDVLSRPPSRLSLGGCTSYYETDFETEDELESYPITKSADKHKAFYGHIAGVPVGTEWKFRRQCSRCSVHSSPNAGIHGGPEGAYSMVLSSVYALDDRGEEFRYYGEGGRDPKTKKLVCDQKMTRGNLALKHNLQTGNPVRVIRGFQLKNKYSPHFGYRYDGLYEVTQCTELIMGDGFKVFMFNFVRSPNQPPPPWPNERIELPWLSTEFHHNSSASEDEYPQKQQHMKCRQRRQHSSPISEGVRCHTPMSVASDDVPPPELQLPELNPERSVVYPTPPRLSPGFCINPAVIEVQRRPVVFLERLDKDTISKLLASPQEIMSNRTISQSKMSKKRGNNDREALLRRKRKREKKNLNFYKRKKAIVSRKPAKKRGRKKKDEMTNSCSFNTHTHTIRSIHFPHKDG